MNKVIETIFKRRSIREYKDQPVEKEKLDWLMKAAMAAPSARNGQPWEFVIVSDTNQMSALRDGIGSGQYNAPAAVVVLYNPDLSSYPSSSQYFWKLDCSAAMQNMMIAAVSLDLGTVWLGTRDGDETSKNVRKVLGLPEQVIILGIAYVGYPDEEKEAGTRYDAKRVHWDRY